MGVVTKKGFFNFDCFGFVVIYCKNDFLNCKNDFLNFLKRSVWQPFFQKLQKTQGFACKGGVILEFWLHALKLPLAWCEDFCSFKPALKRFLKLN